LVPPENESLEPAARARSQFDTGAPRRDAPGSEREAQAGQQSADGPKTPRRNYALAIVMALLVFALLIGVRVLWGGLGSRHPSLPPATTQEPPAPAQSN